MSTAPDRLSRLDRDKQQKRLRLLLERYATHTVPALGIETYASKVYQANRASCL